MLQKMHPPASLKAARARKFSSRDYVLNLIKKIYWIPETPHLTS
jgi:hypothetical protein